jgi:non-specific serine/threonine protein kinase
LGEEAEPALEGFGGQQVPWLARLDRDIGNIRAALAWLERTGDASRLLRLVAVLDTFWWLRPHHAEVEHWLEIGLRDADIPAALRVDALYVAMGIAYFRGDLAKARGFAEAGLATAETWGDPFAIGRAQINLGRVLMELDDLPQAATLMPQALARFRETRAASWVYLALSEFGSVRQLRGDLEGAVSLLDEALALVRHVDATDPLALQDNFGLSGVLGRRAYAAREAGDLILATQLFSEKLTIAQQLASTPEVLGALTGLAAITLDGGQPEFAARLLGAIDAAREANGLARVAHSLFAKQVESATCRALGDADFNANWHEGRTIPLAEAIADALAQATDASIGKNRSASPNDGTRGPDQQDVDAPLAP